jgi:hypothetical protein
LLIAAVILAEDVPLKKLSVHGGEALTSAMVVYEILVVLMVTRTRLGFTVGLIPSTLMLLAQIVNDFVPLSGFIPPDEMAKFFPNGFTAYVLGFSPVNDPMLCPKACPPFAYSALVFLVLQVPLIFAWYLGLRSEKLSRKGSNVVRTG